MTCSSVGLPANALASSEDLLCLQEQVLCQKADA
jgi:hypothetical protein